TNNGPSDVVGASVVDLLPAAVTAATWNCFSSNGGTCGLSSGAGSVNQLADLPVGASVTYTIRGTVDPSLGTDLINTATVTPPTGVVDPALADNSATDTDTTAPVTDLAITKTDGLTSALPGDVVTYTVVVTNAGPSAATGATVADTIPAALTGVTWTCTAVNG